METYLDGLASDFRYAFRNLRQNRRFSLIAIFALALGIGRFHGRLQRRLQRVLPHAAL